MVGLIAERRLSKSRRSTLKMSSESTEMVDSEKPLSNGTDDEMLISDKDIKKEAGDAMEVVNETEKSDERMDVDKKSDDEEKVKKSDDEGKVKKSDDEGNVKKSDDEGKPKSIKQLRKSRSSRSLSSSSSKINTKPSANEGSSSDTEDFHGFDTTEFQSAPRTRLESVQYARLSITGIPSPDVAGSIDTGSVGEPDDSNLDTSKKRRFKASSSVDLSSPDYRKPFEYGWVREIVYRNAGDNGPRRNADVYYHTPTGKKIRSIREILDHLTDGLTERNFTFSKHPIGLEDETKEIIRDAKNKPSFMKDGLTPPPAKKAVQKPKTPGPLTPTPAPSSSNLTPKILIKGGPTQQKPKPKGNKKLDKKDRRTAGGFPDDGDDEILLLEKDSWSPEKVNSEGSGSGQCSIKCRLALGLIPSLSCAACLCLYHPECVSVSREKADKPNFVFKCKSCKAKQPPKEAKETKVEVAGGGGGGEGGGGSQNGSKAVTGNTPRSGIVGEVTTWFSPSSSVQHGNVAFDPDEKPPGILKATDGTVFVGVSRSTVVNINAGNIHNPDGIYLIPCDTEQHVSGRQLTNGLKRRQDSPDNSEPSPPTKRARTSGEQSDGGREAADPEGGRSGEVSPSKGQRSGPGLANWMNEVSAGFSALLHAFHYLKVFELLRAGCVSKMWQFVASHHSLWETVRMKNSRVSDWNGFARTLASRGTKTLDLRKMLVPEGPEELAAMWEEVATALSSIKSLSRVDVGRCSPQAFASIAAACPHLESLVSTAIKGSGEVDIKPLTVCKQLKELKIKTSPSMEFRNLDCLASFENLSTLALTTCKNLTELTRLPETLQSLELGECTSLPISFAKECLPLMGKLKRLRLEKGQGACPTIELLEAISGQPQLAQLELINFDIKPGFDKAIAKCTNIKTFLVIPTYVTQSATTNHVVMGGVSKLNQTLEYFIWGLTMELLRVTDLFIDQEKRRVGQDKAGKSDEVKRDKNVNGEPFEDRPSSSDEKPGQVENQKGKVKEVGAGGAAAGKKPAPCGDSIPILKPSSGEGDLEGAPSQVDILALPNLQRVLSTLLPTTKIKILKVPFSATWRQVVTDP